MRQTGMSSFLEITSASILLWLRWFRKCVQHEPPRAGVVELSMTASLFIIVKSFRISKDRYRQWILNPNYTIFALKVFKHILLSKTEYLELINCLINEGHSATTMYIHSFYRCRFYCSFWIKKTNGTN